MNILNPFNHLILMKGRFFSLIVTAVFLLSEVLGTLGVAKELEVSLRSEVSTLPIFVKLEVLSNVSQEQKQYVQSLCQIFMNDLAIGDRLAPLPIEKASSTPSILITIKVQYPIIIVSESLSSKEHFKLAPQTLSGILHQDRQLIHHLADIIHEKITGVPGISSGTILFSLSKTSSSSESLKQGELWTIDYDGENLSQITEDGSLSVTPRFLQKNSPTTSPTYLYVSYKLGMPKIFLNSLNNSSGQRIIPLKGNQLMPDMSFTKNRIAFISDITGNPDIFIQPFSLSSGPLGKPYPLLNASFGTQGNPTFSPDGSKLLFVSNKDGSPRIYIMSLDPEPTTPKLLSKKFRNCNCPSWSASGRLIAYCATIKGIRQICIHNTLTKEDQQVTFSPDHKEDPTWTNDDYHLVFSSGSSSQSDIYLLSLITKKTTRITKGPGEKRFPSWSFFSCQPKRSL